MQRFGLDVLRHVAGGSAACAEACAEAGAATVIVAAIRAHPDEGLQAKACAGMPRTQGSNPRLADPRQARYPHV